MKTPFNNMPQTREELAQHFQGWGVELGVARGLFSEHILKTSGCVRLYSIDRWADRTHEDAEYLQALERLCRYPNSVVMRSDFMEAAALFDNGFVDFVFVDGYADTGQRNGHTLSEWWPKLKSGGIFAIHDYHADFPQNVKAIDKFATDHGLTMFYTSEEKYPTAWCIKL